MKKTKKLGFIFNCHSEGDSPKNLMERTKRFFAPFHSALNDGRRAFTLAEVLITLTIIGVIAALTIPNLLQKHQEQEMVTKLKKAYSVFSNAYKLTIIENGEPDEWNWISESSYNGALNAFNLLSKNLKVQKSCGNSSGCFGSTYRTLNKNSAWINFDTNSKYVKGILEDGMSFSIWSASSNCTENSRVKDECAQLTIDVNGKKGPNLLGFDLFQFYLTKSGNILPQGIEATSNSSCNMTTTSKYNGVYCTYWVITKGNMDYLRRDVSSEWK